MSTEMCPVCKGEGQVYRMTPAYEAMVTQANASFGWTAETHEWRPCPLCYGAKVIFPGEAVLTELVSASSPWTEERVSRLLLLLTQIEEHTRRTNIVVSKP